MHPAASAARFGTPGTNVPWRCRRAERVQPTRPTAARGSPKGSPRIRLTAIYRGYTRVMTDSGWTLHRDTDKSGSTIMLHLAGTFDRQAYRELRRALQYALNRAPAVGVVIDVGRVDFIGSECIEALLHGYTRALRAGRGYEITNARGHARQALEITGLCPRDYDDRLYVPAWSDAMDFAPTVQADADETSFDDQPEPLADGVVTLGQARPLF